MRPVVVLSLMTLAACGAPAVPDSGAAARAQVAAPAAAVTTFAPPAPVAAAPLASMPASSGVVNASELAALGIGGGPVGLAQDIAQQQPLPVAPAAPSNNTGLSDEQSFEAVSNRETIESDARRRAQQAAALQVVMPSALPQRPADTGPNIVQYALDAPNRKGQEWYSRSIFSGQGKFRRNCATYTSPDAAQRDFLARGGPDRDPRGLDPDGDGFACGWDPAPFLLAAGGN
nr:hypothetical protein [Loktanella fryxellensis]